jgi:hypothetical protein
MKAWLFVAEALGRAIDWLMWAGVLLLVAHFQHFV